MTRIRPMRQSSSTHAVRHPCVASCKSLMEQSHGAGKGGMGSHRRCDVVASVDRNTPNKPAPPSSCSLSTAVCSPRTTASAVRGTYQSPVRQWAQAYSLFGPPRRADARKAATRRGFEGTRIFAVCTISRGGADEGRREIPRMWSAVGVHNVPHSWARQSCRQSGSHQVPPEAIVCVEWHSVRHLEQFEIESLDAWAPSIHALSPRSRRRNLSRTKSA